MAKYIKDRVALLEAVDFSNDPSRQVTNSDNNKTVSSCHNDKSHPIYV